MAIKIICDKCGEDVGTPRYTFTTTLSQISPSDGSATPMNVSIPLCDLCLQCHKEVEIVLRDLNLPTIASTQT